MVLRTVPENKRVDSEADGNTRCGRAADDDLSILFGITLEAEG
jgi:hypothetical protein